MTTQLTNQYTVNYHYTTNNYNIKTPTHRHTKMTNRHTNVLMHFCIVQDKINTKYPTTLASPSHAKFYVWEELALSTRDLGCFDFKILLHHKIDIMGATAHTGGKTCQSNWWIRIIIINVSTLTPCIYLSYPCKYFKF